MSRRLTYMGQRVKDMGQRATKRVTSLFEKPKSEEEIIIKENCRGLDDCNTDIVQFSKAINDPDCPKQEKKIKKLIKCYNKNHVGNEIGLEILNREGLTNLLQDEEDIKVLEEAQNWLEEEKLMEPRSAILKQGGKYRKSRKMRKSRKSRKMRKSRKSRKNRS
jgi:hypothetical protein